MVVPRIEGMTPGWTEFILIPSLAYWTAIDLVSILTAASGRPGMPALFTIMSSLPNRETVAATASFHCSSLVTSRLTKIAWPPASAISAFDLPSLLLEKVSHRHPGALAGEHPSLLGPHAPGRPRYQSYFTF